MNEDQYQNCIRAIAQYEALTTDEQRDQFPLPINLLRHNVSVYERTMKGMNQ